MRTGRVWLRVKLGPHRFSMARAMIPNMPQCSPHPKQSEFEPSITTRVQVQGALTSEEKRRESEGISIYKTLTPRLRSWRRSRPTHADPPDNNPTSHAKATLLLRCRVKYQKPHHQRKHARAFRQCEPQERHLE